jgi:ABC-2 type transport system permease protein
MYREAKYVVRIVLAELSKQHKVYFNNRIIYMSMFVWPLIMLGIAYGMFLPFTGNQQLKAVFVHVTGVQSVLAFILTGFLGYVSFLGVTQAAWQFSVAQRFSGTLEVLLLSPANRLAIVIANSLGACIESIWPFSLFFILLSSGLIPQLKVINPWWIPASIFIIMVTSIAWGALLNALFIFSRNAEVLYMLFQQMEFFAGVRIPVEIFPLAIKGLSILFPLTFVLVVVRHWLFGVGSGQIVSVSLGVSLGFTMLMLVLASVVMSIGERRAKQIGTLTVF